MTKPREWGPDQNGRWGNNMMYLRDDTADRLIIAHRRAKQLRNAVESGEYTRLELIKELDRIKEETLRAILNLSQAGAPVDIEALDDHISTILSATISSK